MYMDYKPSFFEEHGKHLLAGVVYTSFFYAFGLVPKDKLFLTFLATSTADIFIYHYIDPL